MSGTQGLSNVSTRIQRIAELARQKPGVVLTALAHHIDKEWLHEAYRRTRKDGAVGVDGETAEHYAIDLDGNLGKLLEHFKAGTYRAQPVRRVFIPKADGRQRPIGIPTFEDKVLQRAVLMVLEAVYEQDFLPCSFGFRPGRSAHQALEVARDNLMNMGGGTVVEVDIKGFFDTVDHTILRGFLDKRIGDGVIRKMIDKWLAAGVMEEGRVHRSDLGTPQGGVISPILSNIYLHEVLDTWFAQQVKPIIRGRSFMVRYADDVLMAFSLESEAQRVMAVLPKRFGKYGLTLHPVKTRLIQFRPPKVRVKNDDVPTPERVSFDLLGFTHHWAVSRKGRWVIKRRTSAKSLKHTLTAINEWCRAQRHRPIPEQHEKLKLKLQGHAAYFGITGNSRSLNQVLDEVKAIWRTWLSRRSQRGCVNWEAFKRMLERFPLPCLITVHSELRR